MKEDSGLIVVERTDLADLAQRMILACGYPEAEPQHVNALGAFLARNESAAIALARALNPSPSTPEQ